MKKWSSGTPNSDLPTTPALAYEDLNGTVKAKMRIGEE
jgi:hypothetical protein